MLTNQFLFYRNSCTLLLIYEQDVSSPGSIVISCRKTETAGRYGKAVLHSSLDARSTEAKMHNSLGDKAEAAKFYCGQLQ